MLSTRKMLAAGSAGALLALAAAVPANASPAPDPRCVLENSGALGVTCVGKLNVAIVATMPAAPPTPADCQVAIGVLNDDRAIGIADEQAVTAARTADKLAMEKLKAAEVTRDQAIAAAQSTYTAGVPYVGTIDPKIDGDTQAAANARANAAALAARDAAIASAGSTYAVAQAAYNSGGTAAKLHDALAKLQRDEVAYKRAVVVVNLKCGPATPATKTPPAPVVVESPTIISGQAPPPVVVHDNLPVTG